MRRLALRVMWNLSKYSVRWFEQKKLDGYNGYVSTWWDNLLRLLLIQLKFFFRLNLLRILLSLYKQWRHACQMLKHLYPIKYIGDIPYQSVLLNPRSVGFSFSLSQLCQTIMACSSVCCSVSQIIMMVCMLTYISAIKNVCDSPVVIKIREPTYHGAANHDDMFDLTGNSNSRCSNIAHNSDTPQYECSSLENALMFKQLTMNSSCNVSIILSQAGEHLIHHANITIKSSINIVGYSNQLTTLKCVYPGLKPKRIMYAVYFSRSKYVMLSNLSMEDCPIPLGFDTVTYVHFSNIIIR